MSLQPSHTPISPSPLAVDDGKAGQVVTCGEHDLTGTHEEARWYYLGWVLALLILALVFLAVFTPPVGSDHCTGGGKGSGATPVRCTP